MEGTVLSHYRILQKICESEYSTVYDSCDTQGVERYAIKCIKKKFCSLATRNEIKISQNISHYCIIPIIEVIDLDNLDFCFAIVMKRAITDLFDLFCDFNSLDEKKVSYIIYHVLMALQYLHDMGIVHRNVSLENILIMKDDYPQTDALLAGFSNSTFFTKDQMLKDFYCGNFIYNAPEIHLHKRCFVKIE